MIGPWAFLSGSRRYGRPRPDSDVDLVVRMTRSELRLFEDAIAAKLTALGDEDVNKDAHHLAYDGVTPFRFGPLNLLVVDDQQSWEAWSEATWELIKRKDERGEGVSRGEAVKVHSDLRHQKANPVEPLFTAGAYNPDEDTSPFVPKDGLPF